MKRTAAVVLTLVAATLTGPAVHAASTDVIHGGCTFVSATSDAATGGANVGVIGDLSVTTTGDPTPAPIGAVVTCWITVNGVTAPGTTNSYGDVPGLDGVQAGAHPISYIAGPTDEIALCTSVVFADDSTTSSCSPGFDVVQWIDDLLIWGPGPCGGDLVTQCLDAAGCPVLASMTGDYPGGVSIQPDGDVDVPDPLGLGLDPVYDCPPYVPAPGPSSQEWRS